MKNVTLLLMLGGVLLFAQGCRSSQPPAISTICILDGFGGGNCVLADGSRVYKKPSEMLNYWATTQVDMQNFASWCYKAPVSNVAATMQRIESDAQPQY